VRKNVFDPDDDDPEERPRSGDDESPAQIFADNLGWRNQEEPTH
jgi:hypothetical protein